jgi:hypothetical protein
MLVDSLSGNTSPSKMVFVAVGLSKFDLLKWAQSNLPTSTIIASRVQTMLAEPSEPTIDIVRLSLKSVALGGDMQAVNEN